MNKTRLKLYNDSIYTYINHKDKIKFKNIAFKNNMTVSELSRYLILLIINFNENKKLNSKLTFNDNEFNELINLIGGIFNR